MEVKFIESKFDYNNLKALECRYKIRGVLQRKHLYLDYHGSGLEEKEQLLKYANTHEKTINKFDKIFFWLPENTRKVTYEHFYKKNYINA